MPNSFLFKVCVRARVRACLYICGRVFGAKKLQ